MKRAWLRTIDLDTFQVGQVELSGRQRLTVGRAGDVVIPSSRLGTEHCAFVRTGDVWRIESHPASRGVFVNDVRTESRVLEHGDAVWLFDGLLVFLEGTPPVRSRLEASIDENPNDPARIQVWRDACLERTEGPVDPLEGLGRLRDAGHLELESEHGLIRTVRIRSVNDGTRPEMLRSAGVELLAARLVALPEVRWLRSLTVDLASWTPLVGTGPSLIQQRVSALMRRLSTGPDLPHLEHLSFGSFPETMDSMATQQSLIRLRSRSPRLFTAGAIVARKAWLELAHLPEALDFHAPSLHAGRIPLDGGIWAGAASPGQLRVLAPAGFRQTAFQSFSISAESPQWHLLPLDEGVRLNGHRCLPTRLLPGDVIEDRNGARFRFQLG